MSVNKFTVSEAFGFGWKSMLDNFLPLIGFGLLAIAISLLPVLAMGMIIGAMHQTDSWIMRGLAQLIHFAVTTIASLGIIKILLAIYDKKSATTAEFFSSMGSFLNYLGCSLLMGLIITAGLILLVVPGIYWALQFSLAPFCVVDQKMGPIEALKKSAELTKGIKWQLLGFAVLSYLITFVGLICIIVGLIPALLTVALAQIYIYRKCLEYVPEAHAGIHPTVAP